MRFLEGQLSHSRKEKRPVTTSRGSLAAGVNPPKKAGGVTAMITNGECRGRQDLIRRRGRGAGTK